jgi:hypothetical protein
MEATSESHAPNVPVKRKASDRSRGHPRPHPLDRADPPRRDRRRQVAGHLEHLSEIRDPGGNARERLEAVLGAYALMTYERPHGTELTALLNRGEHIVQAHQHLSDFIRDLLAEAAKAGDIRDDVAPGELLPPRPRGSRQPAVEGRGPQARHGHPCRDAPQG